MIGIDLAAGTSSADRGPDQLTEALGRQLTSGGFCHCERTITAKALEQRRPGCLEDWDAFADSWGRLGRDPYMGDGGRYRYRRHATFEARAGQPPERLTHAAHYQDLSYNRLNGGIERWFEPIEHEVAALPVLQAILSFARDVFGSLNRTAGWFIELHQFRIVAEAGAHGLPTPEGIHRDGVDYVLVMMIRRQNIASGRTDLYAGHRPVASFTLVEPLSSVLLDDHRLAHGVTPVEPVDPEAPSYRDVLVVTFRDATARAAPTASA